MTNPENNHNLPTPENPSNGFSIEILNLNKIYDTVLYSSFKEPRLLDDKHSHAGIGSLEVNDGFVRTLSAEIRGSNRIASRKQHEFSFWFEISRQNDYKKGSDNIKKKFLSEEEVKSISDELEKTTEKSDYQIDKFGYQYIFVKQGGFEYLISCGMRDINDAKKICLPGISEEEMKTYSLIVTMVNPYQIKERIYDNFIPMVGEDEFKRRLFNFSLVCEKFVNALYVVNKLNYSQHIPFLMGEMGFNVDDTTMVSDHLESHRSYFNGETVKLNDSYFLKSEEKSYNFGFSNIAGQSRAVAEARKLVLAINHPEVYEKRGVKTPKGILFYGPPGTGKTLIAKAIASEIDAELFEVSFSDIGSKWYGESEQRIQEIFDNANKVTKTGKKAIILFDELDSMAPSRSDSYEGSKKIVSIILQNLDGFRSNKDVMVIGTTNRPEDIDPALKRPGRIDKIIAVGLPNLEDRKAILQLHIGKAIERSTESHDLFSTDLDIQKIAESTEGMSGADLANIINLTLESKTVLELEGLRWTPVTVADIERTLIDFNLKKQEKNKIGFN